MAGCSSVACQLPIQQASFHDMVVVAVEAQSSSREVSIPACCRSKCVPNLPLDVAGRFVSTFGCSTVSSDSFLSDDLSPTPGQDPTLPLLQQIEAPPTRCAVVRAPIRS